jgi:hypothetical protein
MKDIPVIYLIIGGLALVLFIKTYNTVEAIGSDIASPVTNTVQGFFNLFN